MRTDLDSLLAAVAAEGRDLDLSGAIRHSGWESLVVETRDGWILRFPRPGVAFEREIAILRRLTGRLPVLIPDVEWTGRHTRFAAYRKLEGSTFDLAQYAQAPGTQRDVLAGSLAGFLAAMHDSLTVAEIEALEVPAFPDTTADIATQLHRVPHGARRAVEELLDVADSLIAADSGTAQVVLHDDFHFGNMVLDGPVGEVTSVWDFSCVRLGEPSLDLRYVADDSMDLFRRVAAAYERLTARRIDVRVAVVASRLEGVSDALELDRPDTGADRLAVADM